MLWPDSLCLWVLESCPFCLVADCSHMCAQLAACVMLSCVCLIARLRNACAIVCHCVPLCAIVCHCVPLCAIVLLALHGQASMACAFCEGGGDFVQFLVPLCWRPPSMLRFQDGAKLHVLTCWRGLPCGGCKVAFSVHVESSLH
ncbi:unnamed protein product [Symbiodinium natans]|uniref:Uncharacterized protein n=1 Tax=Symbiodinium natans TaxID=878477 RepID=A0A812LIJ9_9DINO|nr:unnamed protein product [Symbiodinium natans]